MRPLKELQFLSVQQFFPNTDGWTSGTYRSSCGIPSETYQSWRTLLECGVAALPFLSFIRLWELYTPPYLGRSTGGWMSPSLGAEQDRRCRVFFPSQTSQKINFMDKPAVKLLIKQTVLNHVIMDCNFNSFKLRFKLN